MSVHEGGLARVSVVYLSTYPGAGMGGGEVHLIHLVRGAVAAGMRVTVIAVPGSGTAAAARQAGARVVEDDLLRVSPMGAPRRLTAHLRSAEAAIVHSTSPYTALIARLAGPRAGARVIDAIHTEPTSTLAFRSGVRARISQLARDAADRLFRSRSAVLVADSVALARAHIERGVPGARVVVVHNAVDAPALREEAASTDAPAPVTAAELAIGTVGRLDPVKGLDVLLDAVPTLAVAHPGVRFFVAGEGPLRADLEARIAADPLLRDHVTLLGFVEHLAPLLAALDIYCLPSRSEGFNTTVLEAMALGVPVVATDVGGTREAVEDGVTGRLVTPGDSQALAAALAELVADADARSGMGRSARELVDERFTTDVMVRRTLEVYEDVLASRPVRQ